MRKLKERRGVTLAEALIVVGILIVVMAVAFIAVWNYQRSMHQLEYDGIAKEIFIAAQNHLTDADGQGFLEKGTSVGNNDSSDPSSNVYYFIVGGSGAPYTSPVDENSLLSLMLPLASVDETVRLGGSYVIRYQKDPAQILDVFYSPKTGRYAHVYTAGEYDELISDYRGDANKMKRRDYSGAILGYYGGVEAQNLPTVVINKPTLELVNAERLYAKITPENVLGDSNKIQIKLIVTGKTSGNSKVVPIISADGSKADRVDMVDDGGGNVYYTVSLDDITTANRNFNYLFCTTGAGYEGDPLIPGEDIEVKAIAFSNEVPSNIAASGVRTANSLFADETVVNDGTASAAVIKNIRHLENLDHRVSGIPQYPSTATERVKFDKAEQTTDMSWREFKEAIDGAHPENVSIFMNGSTAAATGGGNYLPVEAPASLEYNGSSHRISDVTVSTAGDAGLFSELVNGGVKNLELVDFDIESTGGAAGALAGKSITSSSSISGILVRNTITDSDAGLEITGKTSAGGVIGQMIGGKLECCGAAVYVKATGADTHDDGIIDEGSAGGLAGMLDRVSVESCYSGGHTKDGGYLTTESGEARVNVTGPISAGGLIGESRGTTVAYSYSTCSAKGAAAGGLIGSAAVGTQNGAERDTSVTGSYATGLVTGDSGSVVGSFVGKLSVTDGANVGTLYSGNSYFGAVTNDLRSTGSSDSAVTATPFDTDVESYNNFAYKTNYRVGGNDASPAYAYDDWLVFEFGGRTDMPTIKKIAPSSTQTDDWPEYLKDKHWGDWPSPETKVVNEKTTAP